MGDLFHRNRQLLLLTVLLVVVWGLSSLLTLPRLEDPLITQRNALVITTLPGATPERVEALITKPLEDALLELEEVDALSSTSSTGSSVIAVVLKDGVRQVAPAWSKVRSKIDDATPLLPPEATDPEFRDGNVGASALIVGLTWELPGPADLGLLSRLADDLQTRLRAIPGTNKVEISGEPEEEIRVEIGARELARLGLTARDLSERIAASDAKEAAGQVRSERGDFLLQLDGALDSLERIRSIPLTVGADGASARLAQVAEVSRGVRLPAAQLALVHGQPAVVVAATVAPSVRLDHWANDARQLLEEVRATLPAGLGLHTVLDQSRYVQERLDGVINNLITGSLLVVAVSVLMLGGRAALVVGAALPLTALMVLGCLRVLEVPLHQMSATGLVIALGLLIDNAIVVVEELQQRLRAGTPPGEAVRQTSRYLLVPMLAATLTTVLSFVPIATSPGATGEFIGTIGLTVILALACSLLLSLAVILAVAARLHRWQPLGPNVRWWEQGLAIPALTGPYRAGLQRVLRHPWQGVALSLVLPVLGFACFASLERQFFPPTNRDQFQIELRLPQQSAIARTEALALEARRLIRRHPSVEDVHWFLGESAPQFFYNVIADQENAPHYAQGLVQLRSAEGLRDTIRSLQQSLDRRFPDAQVLVKQLEQGPPFAAPIELRLQGPDLQQLRRIGDDLRRRLAQIEAVTHTSASLSEALPRLALAVDEEQARRTGLDNRAIARQLQAGLDGAVGGSIQEGTTTLPVRVQVAAAQRDGPGQLAALDLVAPGGGGTIPLDALAALQLEPELASITRRDGQRINAVRAYLAAGTLPSSVLAEFRRQLEHDGWQLPAAVQLSYGGEADARGDAVGSLLSTAGVLMVLMTATLVLSFRSFRLAALIASVAVLSVGLAALALQLSGSLFGFTAILGTLGLIGLAVNDSIVVLNALRTDPAAARGDTTASTAVVLHATRHVLATTLTTVTGFLPLMLDPTGFWPPLAIAVSGGLVGATALALFYVPAAHALLMRPAAEA
ncbi:MULTISPECIES: efflux RND transporter permease subunit [unclassified Synechococcus]|uniref:efflux RND transporter permease subunit n=1 Tax=unclassified Synechococcus TaxID=2626047 RepID=UPI0021A620E2|nr:MULTISPECIES: efflux RND transporter permease subunit [unclassified Synechococcus]MCT0213246.1 efflux RND transporter permease subunit [Synechococcus sp. CS-1326]MCT0231941.1 efflux RND transporter permease subunit [Synechococcus sp. CS-1327]